MATTIGRPAGSGRQSAVRTIMPEVRGLARPIQAAIRVEIRRSAPGPRRRCRCRRCRSATGPSAARSVPKRQERQIAVLLDRDEHRTLLAPQLVERRQATPGPSAPVVAVSAGSPLAPTDRDAGAVDRRAGADRLHEHVARPVLRLLDDEAEVGDQDQPRVLQADVLALAAFVVALALAILRAPRVTGGVLLRIRRLGPDVQQEQAAPAGRDPAGTCRRRCCRRSACPARGRCRPGRW